MGLQILKSKLGLRAERLKPGCAPQTVQIKGGGSGAVFKKWNEMNRALGHPCAHMA